MTQSKKSIVKAAKEVAAALGVLQGDDLEPRLRVILETCCDDPRLFSGKDVLSRNDKQIAAYLKKNIAGYHREIAGFTLPRNKEANIDKAMFEVLRALSPDLKGSSDVQLTRVLQDHKACMVAENVLGDLLERYVAPVLAKKGWIWCAGRLVKTVDFLKPGKDPRFLQVKSGFNSENSSSSGYRVEGGIPSWYRKSANGVFNWDTLEDNDGTLSEEGFQSFVKAQVETVPSRS